MRQSLYGLQIQTTGAYSTAQTASVTVSYPCLTLLPTYLVPGNYNPGGVLTVRRPNSVWTKERELLCNRA